MVQPNALVKDVEIKGSLFPLSILQLEVADLSILATQLEYKRQQAKDFFYRAPLVINIEKTQGALFDFKQLKQVIEDHHFICVGVCNATIEQATAAMTAGLAILKQPRSDSSKSFNKELPSKEAASKLTQIKTKETEPENQTALKQRTAKVIKQNVRSGQQIYAKDTDLIVIGSVGNGAEVIADGNIHIYGHLRGRALAGASGATQSIIYCQSMEAELVSIAGNYWLSDQLPEDIWQQSALFNFESDKLSAQPIGFNGKKN
ncbi:MAG: septum site-determining protein MinC [Oceanospirillaceae bacterium]|jgi:septum site-determining protein MinC